MSGVDRSVKSPPAVAPSLSVAPENQVFGTSTTLTEICKYISLYIDLAY